MRIIIYILTMITAVCVHGQNNIEMVLSKIEENNTTLKALRDNAEAQKLNNKTGIYLPGPEIEFNYLWGKPGIIGNRTDLNIKQQFDIQTISGQRSRLAYLQNNLTDLQYKSDRINILLDSKILCIDLIYYNKLRYELTERLKHAQAIADSYKERLNQGDINVLENNKIQLNLLMVQGELAKVEIERKSLSQAIKQLNGGLDLSLDDLSYSKVTLPSGFDKWFSKAEQESPVLAYISQELEISKKKVTLSKSMRLPQFTAGFMSEKVVGQQYQGVSFGLSIPLWENKNRIKQAEAQVKAAESMQIDSRQLFYEQLKNRYSRAEGLNTTAQAYKKSLTALSNTSLLKKALSAGEISLLDYIVEMGLYYNTVNQALEAERDYQKAFATLSAMKL